MACSRNAAISSAVAMPATTTALVAATNDGSPSSMYWHAAHSSARSAAAIPVFSASHLPAAFAVTTIFNFE